MHRRTRGERMSKKSNTIMGLSLLVPFLLNKRGSRSLKFKIIPQYTGIFERHIRKSLETVKDLFPNKDVELMIFASPAKDGRFNDITELYRNLPMPFVRFIENMGFRPFPLTTLTMMTQSMVPMDYLATSNYCSRQVNLLNGIQAQLNMYKSVIISTIEQSTKAHDEMFSSTVWKKKLGGQDPMKVGLVELKKYLRQYEAVLGEYESLFLTLSNINERKQNEFLKRFKNKGQPPMQLQTKYLILFTNDLNPQYFSKSDYARDFMADLGNTLLHYTGLDRAKDLWSSTEAIYKGVTYKYAPLAFRSLMLDPEYTFMKRVYRSKFSHWRLFFQTDSNAFFAYFFYAFEMGKSKGDNLQAYLERELLPANSEEYREMVVFDIANRILEEKYNQGQFLISGPESVDLFEGQALPIEEELIEDIRKNVTIVPGSINREVMTNVLNYVNKILNDYTFFPIM